MRRDFLLLPLHFERRPPTRKGSEMLSLAALGANRTEVT